jgi:solute carrier family 50 protein (sugar transporter)
MSVEDIFLKWVFPLLGGIVGTLMFMAPLSAVLKARRLRDLGALNPVPYPAQAANSIAWIAYSYVIVPTNKSGSALLYWVNQLGFLFGLFFTLSCYGLARTKTRDRILAQVLFFALVIPLVGAVGVLTEMSSDRLKLMWGFTANGILLLYYAAPLSTVLSVIRTKSSKSLNLPLAIMQCVNGCLWLGYGIAVSDPFIYVPNAVGACTGAVLLLLLFSFRERRRNQDVEPQVDSDSGSSTDKGDGGQDPKIHPDV